MSQSSSNQSSLRSAGSTPLEAISEDETPSTFTLPSPALGFSTGKHLHSVKQAYHKPPMPKAPSPSPSPTTKAQKKAPMTKEDRMAMLLKFTSERDDDEVPFRLPPPKQSYSVSSNDTKGDSEAKRSIFKRMSERLGSTRE